MSLAFDSTLPPQRPNFKMSLATDCKYSTLLPPNWRTKVTEWLQEDIPSFDYGGFVVGDKQDTATLYCKANGVLAGRPMFDEVFRQCDCLVEWLYDEGTSFVLPTNTDRIAVAYVYGSARNILIGERTGLNMLARCSGIATRGRYCKDIRDSKKWHGQIAGTRKTTPGFRLVEKYALLVGGVDTHRMDLSSMIMLKDNHVWSRGNITKAVHSAKNVGGFSLKIEVECRSLEEAQEAMQAGANVVMLDNMEPEELKKNARILKSENSSVLVEASGGITIETIADFFDPCVDVISMGWLTQGVPHIDFSLKIDRK